MRHTTGEMKVFSTLLSLALVGTATAATELTLGTATASTQVALETPTLFTLTLGITTLLADTNTITCTFTKPVGASNAASTLVVDPASSGAAAAWSGTAVAGKILTITSAAATIPTGTTHFKLSTNLAANYNYGDVGVSCVSTTDTEHLVVSKSFTTTATKLTKGTSEPSTHVGGATPTSFVLTLGIFTQLTTAASDTITCTYGKQVWAAVALSTVVSSPTNAGITATATDAGKIITITPGATLATGSTTFTFSSNLAANYNYGDVSVSCVSTQDKGALVVAASFTTLSTATHSKETCKDETPTNGDTCVKKSKHDTWRTVAIVMIVLSGVLVIVMFGGFAFGFYEMKSGGLEKIEQRLGFGGEKPQAGFRTQRAPAEYGVGPPQVRHFVSVS